MPLEPKEFPHLKNLAGFSQRALAQHHKLYAGYVRKYNEIAGKIAAIHGRNDPLVSVDISSIKGDMVFALGGVKNHELYFDILSGNGKLSPGQLKDALDKNFGNFETYLADLRQTAVTCRGWAWTILDLDLGNLSNFAGDAQNTFPVWNAVPILALDMYEHAFFYDFEANKPAYIAAFLNVLDWKKVEARYQSARRLIQT